MPVLPPRPRAPPVKFRPKNSKRGHGGIEPPTSPTLKENHTTRPMPHTGDQLTQKKTSVSNLQGTQNKITRAQPESNRRPQDLQSHALPLSYAPVVCEIAHLFFAICWVRLKKKCERSYRDLNPDRRIQSP